MEHFTYRAFSLIGMMVSLVIMLVLSVLLLNGLNDATTGQKSAKVGTVASLRDKEYLRGLFQGMAYSHNDLSGSKNSYYLTPSIVAGDDDISRNTTANLYSAMIIQRYTVPQNLISGNEYNPDIWMDEDYNMNAYDPYNGVFWDTNFKADLAKESNVSFAHMPLYGKRYQQHWKFTVDSRSVLFGNRGPAAGVDNPDSLTYGRNKQWGGHIVFGDGHVDFVTTFFAPGVSFSLDGVDTADNIFAMEDGEEGIDAILSFTKLMHEYGPELQYD
ncbi:MAG: prepilin-type N-terminal cleavage/methylation domain-containing protein [Planctomycetes bacterium]|nr:prepilin-type N-terminal cleavage/methylation domain-containing protein [Planctomycetota bacterium]